MRVNWLTMLDDDEQDAVDCFVLTLVKLELAEYEDLDRILAIFDSMRKGSDVEFRWDAGL